MGDGATLFPQPPGPQGVYYVNPNLLINGDFRVNQRGQVTNVALAAGAYGHDRWKAGAAGCTYTFVQLKSSTLITITAGSLIQVVEDANVPDGGAFVLSQAGSAQARMGVNSATPSGAYAAGPLLVSGQTAGTTMSVEFGVGTLGKVKLEAGLVATPFVMPDYQQELARCLRYFETSGAGARIIATGFVFNTAVAIGFYKFDVSKRVPPTILFKGTTANFVIEAAGTGVASTSAPGTNFGNSNVKGAVVQFAATGLTAGQAVLFDFQNDAEITANAEL